MTKRQVLIQWIADLRSGEYKQTHHSWGDGKERCAVSVLLAQKTHPGLSYGLNDARLPNGHHVLKHAMWMNDVGRQSFSQIADWLEKEALPQFPADDVLTVAPA